MPLTSPLRLPRPLQQVLEATESIQTSLGKALHLRAHSPHSQEMPHPTAPRRGEGG